MAQATRRARIGERLRLGIAAGRVLRVSVLTAVVVLALLGGAAALWLSAKPVRPEPTASRLEPRPEPPIRLDRLPAPRSSAPRRTKRTDANVAPVIGVGTERFGDAEASGDATLDVDGEKPAEEVASDAQIKRQLAALERENARIEAALRGARGPTSGTGRLAWPVRGGDITSPFGQRWGRLHAGVDIGIASGSPVYSSDSGRVAVSGSVGGYGNYICIQHTRSLSTCYGHNTSLGVRKGESVRKGDPIARSGCTGSCTGPHVHFETRVGGRPVDPMRYF